ncbi:hypothetical protein DMI70_03815 [Escherichia coli]|nr:hypothetical protein [Escherichia coli]
MYYRTARCTGLSTSAAAAGLIASVVTLAISPSHSCPLPISLNVQIK